MRSHPAQKYFSKSSSLRIHPHTTVLASLHPCGFIPAKTTLARALMPRFQQDFQQDFQQCGPIPHNHPGEGSDAPPTLKRSG